MPAHKKDKLSPNTHATYGKEVREALAKISRDYILDDGVKGLKNDLAGMRPIDRAQTVEKYLKFWLPTMGTVTVKGGVDGDEPVQITVSYHSPDPNKKADDDGADEQDYSETV